MAVTREDPLSLFSIPNPSFSSSPVSASDAEGSALGDPSQVSSAANSFQNDSYLGGGCDAGSVNEAEYGFSRPDFRKLPLAGTVEMYERHVFLCYKNPAVWPPRIEAAEFDRLPRILAAALAARKPDIKRQTRFTICEGHDGTETSNGDVLIFPDMIRYRRLTHFDVDTFVEEVLVKDGEWLPGSPDCLRGWYIFVCCHGTRDRRCGVCGPAIVAKFKDEIEASGLKGKVFVSPCSHIGGHKYAGNMIIFGPNAKKEVTGHWYGHVTPEDVPVLLEQHVAKGEIVNSLWRGQMGLSEEDQKRSQEERSRSNGSVVPVDETTFSIENHVINSCCQTNGAAYASCCQNNQQIPPESWLESDPPAVNGEKKNRSAISDADQGMKYGRRMFPMPKWYDFWGREDTYAVVSVVVAAASVFAAYKCIKQQN
ncbi:hypothetical protein M569_13938 [Genlisea aurea]|uniref:Uncharacterized protein n=1 Tax=Genlisea aurea TaxID=192259 RepID=S8C2I3_9LAMI|nr:hypothetical protein M569_13938 [Genlisea aurea]